MRLLALAPMGFRMVIFIVIILFVKNTFDVLANLLEEIHVVCWGRGLIPQRIL